MDHIGIRWMLLTGFTVMVREMSDMQLYKARKVARGSIKRSHHIDVWKMWTKSFEAELNRRYEEVQTGNRAEFVCCCGVVFKSNESHYVRYRRVACGC